MHPSASSNQDSLTVSTSAVVSFARKLLVLVCLTIAISECLPDATAQKPEADDEVLRVNTDLLVFPVRIRDKQKNPASLTEKDLSLKDPDGVTAGLYLYHGVDRVALVFALDQSGSTREIISQQRDAAVGLFERFGERSKIAVITFTETPKLVADFGRRLKHRTPGFRNNVSPRSTHCDFRRCPLLN